MPDDSVWKEVLDAYFEDFLCFFFPDIHRDIEWGEPYRFLDKELQQIAPRSDSGRRYADKLIEVALRTGCRTWILLHVEVQGAARGSFAQRMYVYNYRISERYGREVVSLGLLTERRRPYRGLFQHKRWGFELTLRFPVAQLANYRGREKELEAERNPFAVVVLAHLRRDVARNAGERLQAKTALTRLLYERRFKKRDIINLFRFMDWLIELPQDLDRQFTGWLATYQEQRNMPYVTSVERVLREQAREEGVKEGLREGLREAITIALRLRFGNDAVRVLDGLPRDVNPERLREISALILDDAKLEDVTSLIERLAPEA